MDRDSKGNKTITCVQDYAEAIDLIETFSRKDKKYIISDDLKRNMEKMCTRQVGKKLSRIATPVERMDPAEV